MNIIGMDKAQAFYGLAKDGKLISIADSWAHSIFYRRKDAEAARLPEEKVVRVYLIVEDY